MEVEVKVAALMVDPLTNMPIVVLKSEASERVLPIWVGVAEANAIALKRESVETPRPMTHDLILNLLDSLEARVERIVITDLRDNTFYALIHLSAHSGALSVDSRPSDAIAVALRTESPIFVEDAVLDKAATLEEDSVEGEDSDRLRQWFENVDPEEFSKYKM